MFHWNSFFTTLTDRLNAPLISDGVEGTLGGTGNVPESIPDEWLKFYKALRLLDFGRQLPMKSTSSRRADLLTASKSAEGSRAWADGEIADGEVAAEIIAACQQGDPVAQRHLYDASHQNVYRLVVRMVGVQEATDVTQQVFLQVFRKIGQFSGRSQIGTWIYRVAVNESLQYLRKAKRTQMQVLEQEPMDRSPEGRGNIDDKELLEQALAQLEPDLRSTFLLREIEGFSYGAIASALEIPEGTVGSRLNRARRELKQHLVELGWEL